MAPLGLMLDLLTADRGVGSIACGPISEVLINAKWLWTGERAMLKLPIRYISQRENKRSQFIRV